MTAVVAADVGTASRAAIDGARGDLAALDHQRPRFVAYVRRRAPAADADDVVQQAFVTAVARIETLRDRDKLVPWFFRVLRRTLADTLARRAAEARRLAELRSMLPLGTPEEAASCACALGLLDGMGGDHAAILRAIDLDDEPIAAFAARHELTTNAATVRLHRARKHMRTRIARVCGATTARACRDCACG